MMKKTLIITDLHLTENPNDEYRWDIFNVARNFIVENACENLFILGDIFDKKDKHSSALLNKLVGYLKEIKDFIPITILQGNHDYFKDPYNAFLKVLGEIEGITWIDEPCLLEEFNAWFLPHSRQPEDDWNHLKIYLEQNNIDFVFMHQSVIGSKTESHYELTEGLSPSYFENVSAKIISGDIHVPQIVGKVNYIGMQYPKNYGDDFQPRMLFIDNNYLKWILLKTINKHSINIEVTVDDNIEKVLKSVLQENDQCIVNLLLSNSELSNWAHYKEITKQVCKDLKVYLHEVKMAKLDDNVNNPELKNLHKHYFNTKEIFQKFSEIEKLDEELIKIGESFLS